MHSQTAAVNHAATENIIGHIAPAQIEAQPFLPFALPEIGEEEIAEVAQSLRSGWVTTGPKSKQFETDFSAWLGGGVESIAVNSATAGLHLALEALGIGP